MNDASKIRVLSSLILLITAVGFVEGKTAPAPEPAQEVILRAEIYNTGWFEGDCAYHGAYVAPDGKVFFTVSSHMAQQSARLYMFDPNTKQVRLLWTADQTIPKDGSITQGKIHSPLTEYDGEIYLATHDAWYHKDHINPATGEVQKPYKGGYVVAVSIATGKGRIVAAPLHNRPATVWIGGAKAPESIPLDGQALITSLFDTRNGRFYALTWPSGILLKIDVKSGKVSDYGPQYAGAESVPKTITGSDGAQIRNPEYQSVQRTLGLDAEGNVFGSRVNGEIWKYDPKTDKIMLMKAKMGDGTGIEFNRSGNQQNNWRTILWDEKDQVFYGVHWATSWLFKYDPKADKINPVTPWRAQKDLKAATAKDYAQLGLAMGPRHTLYGLVHSEPNPKFGGKRSVHLITYNLDQQQYKDHGLVVGNNDLVLMFNESCAVAPNGDVYTVGWILADPTQREEIKRKRDLGPSETSGHGYLMSLVRIPAQNVKLVDN